MRAGDRPMRDSTRDTTGGLAAGSSMQGGAPCALGTAGLIIGMLP